MKSLTLSTSGYATPPILFILHEYIDWRQEEGLRSETSASNLMEFMGTERKKVVFLKKDDTDLSALVLEKMKFHVTCTDRKQTRSVCAEMLTAMLTCETTGHFCLLCFLYVLNFLQENYALAS